MSMRVRGAAELEAGANWDDPAMFAELVARDALGQADQHESAYLRRPERLDRWRERLVALSQHTQVEQIGSRARVEASRGDRAQYLRAIREHAEWSSRAGHFRTCVEERLRECKRLQRERAGVSSVEDRVAVLEEQVRRLAGAVNVVDIDEVAS